MKIISIFTPFIKKDSFLFLLEIKRLFIVLVDVFFLNCLLACLFAYYRRKCFSSSRFDLRRGHSAIIIQLFFIDLFSFHN